MQLLVTNLGMAATFTHLLLWNRDDLAAAWSWMTPETLKQMWTTFDWKFWRHDGMEERARLYQESETNKDIDPHYREMLKYKDAPNSWYFVTFVINVIIALVVIYKTNSTLPWSVVPTFLRCAHLIKW